MEDELEDEVKVEEEEEEEENEIKEGEDMGEAHVNDEEREKRVMEFERSKQKPLQKYEVIGTLLEYKYPYPEEVTRIIKDTDSREVLLCELMKCGIIIYDITQDRSQIEEASWVLEAIQEILESSDGDMAKKIGNKENKKSRKSKRKEKTKIPRYFILISTIMTWAFTKPLDPEDPDLPFTEVDYRKRRAHPNFKEHLKFERDVVIVKKRVDLKEKLKTIVICCGITYGEEQNGLHYLFKMAWLNEPFLPIIGNGKNKIPLLHVRDLISIVRDVIKNWPTLRYIVAVEQGIASQSEIVKHISKELTTGKVKRVGLEESFLYPEITQRIYDLMTLDLNIDPVYVLERIRWHFDTPFTDNIEPIVEEYKAWRELHPMRIIVLGPPASGKTRVANYLVEHYRLHYINVKNLINDSIKKLSAEIEEKTALIENKDRSGEKGEQTEEENDIEEESVPLEDLQRQLDEIRNNLAQNDGRLDDITLNKLFLKRLWSKDCLNQGYVIDGYPKTYEQAKILFEYSEEIEEEEEEENEEEEEEEEEEDEEGEEDKEILEEMNVKASIIPRLVVVLDASDDFLKERVINLSEREIQGTHYTEKDMIRRLKEYRERNTDDNTPLQFFDEIEVHPLIISIENDICPDMFPTIYQCLKKLGAPKNYGLTPEEAEEAQRDADAKKKAEETAFKIREKREIEERKRERERKMMEWTDLLEKLQEEEEEKLSVMGQPLRHYLVRYVFPTLTKGLIQVAKLRPDDPIDFLAEYLFKENPEGKMFQPDYTETMSLILDAINQLADDIFPKEKELHDVTTRILKAASDASVLPTSSLAGKRYDSHNICAIVTPKSSKESSSIYESESGKEEDFEFYTDSQDGETDLQYFK
ncbi:hypothetical protein M0804_002993 [Polistes exclamans]|nr:hypothetical protein M0804_002993 [Polistes exclamans]